MEPWHHTCYCNDMAILGKRKKSMVRARTPNKLQTLTALLLFGFVSGPIAGQSIETAKHVKEAEESSAPAVLWREPADIATRDLYYGPGGMEHAPRSTTFTFVKEDLDGTNPKFVVRDTDGVKWKIKLGAEAKPETAATRFVWAVGYFADEDYFAPQVRVLELPAHLHRGGKLVAPDGSMRNVRLKREDRADKKAGIWEWKDDPFTGTREFNGLRVLMALINNWDLKDVNNSFVYDSAGAERIFWVHDLGASFGTNGVIANLAKAKGNLPAYRRSKFITQETADQVSFATPGRPAFLLAGNLPQFLRRVHMRWIGRKIPRADAKWMGELLSRLTPAQIRDAFRASGFSPLEVEQFDQVVEERIADLKAL